MVDRSSPRYLEVSHIAHRLSVSDEYVLRLIRAKKLKAIKLGKRYRIEPGELEKFEAAARALNDEEPATEPVSKKLHAVPSTKGA